MNILGNVHGKVVHNRRVLKLSSHLSKVLPPQAKVLDVGCGDGFIASLIMKARPDVSIQGIDVLVRPKTHIKVTEYDGIKIPFDDNSFDVVMFVDVLHHTDDPLLVLREAERVASHSIVVKDHTDDGLLSNQTLRFMDWVGNKPHGVRLPYNYWTSNQWNEAIKTLNLKNDVWEQNLNIYPKTVDWLFGRSLHFVARLACR
ncbi:MAG TPA: class I SAM-dependent methyltransferase [Pyrinomonadaceae bacterium]|nr:class I SAM-dependent methyltransferase [Pyrinomonadaceae bacterium]